jgi:branched-chain amino acid aminotransferase
VLALTLQTFDGDELSELIKKLVMLDSEWIPQDKGFSLYIRQLDKTSIRPPPGLVPADTQARRSSRRKTPSAWVPRATRCCLSSAPRSGRTMLVSRSTRSSEVERSGTLTPSGGFKPVQLLATTKYVRAAPGGTGGYKLGAK